MENAKADNVRNVRNAGNVGTSRQSVRNNLYFSDRRGSQELTFRIQLMNDLGLYPYKIQFNHSINHHCCRPNFSAWEV